mmetsp:Transcript_71420/g.209686  ORF Transcript_71420/g.209686 Transcript_71420/m.209686 type:complete len:205 (+) Transcript_71420:98-712(+)
MQVWRALSSLLRRARLISIQRRRGLQLRIVRQVSAVDGRRALGIERPHLRLSHLALVRADLLQREPVPAPVARGPTLPLGPPFRMALVQRVWEDLQQVALWHPAAEDAVRVHVNLLVQRLDVIGAPAWHALLGATTRQLRFVGVRGRRVGEVVVVLGLGRSERNLPHEGVRLRALAHRLLGHPPRRCQQLQAVIQVLCHSTKGA